MYFWPKFSHRNREHFQKGDLETGAATGNKGTLKAAQMHWRLTLTPTTCLMCYHCVVVVATPCLASLIFCTASSANFTYLSLADHYFHKCDAQAQASNVIVLFFCAVHLYQYKCAWSSVSALLLTTSLTMCPSAHGSVYFGKHFLKLWTSSDLSFYNRKI